MLVMSELVLAVALFACTFLTHLNQTLNSMPELNLIAYVCHCAIWLQVLIQLLRAHKLEAGGAGWQQELVPGCGGTGTRG